MMKPPLPAWPAALFMAAALLSSAATGLFAQAGEAPAPPPGQGPGPAPLPIPGPGPAPIPGPPPIPSPDPNPTATPTVTPAPAAEHAVAVAVAPCPAGVESFAAALGAAIGRELAGAGFGPVSAYGGASVGDSGGLPGEGGGPDGDEALARAAMSATGARWAATVRCSEDKRRVLWRLSVFDSMDGALVASDARATFAGLSAFPSIDESAAVVAAAAAALRGRTAPGAPIDYRIRFTSPDDGAAVAFGGGASSRVVGTITDGELTAPYAGFESGAAIVVTLTKDGYWPRAVTFKPGLADEPVPLPALMPRTSHSLATGMTAGRLLGLSADYRFYAAPDSAFVRAGTNAWLQGAEGSDVAVIHGELRLGLGAYLFPPRPSRFRIAAGTGASGIVSLTRSASETTDAYFDLSLDAVWVSYEWHWPKWAVFLEQRTAYSFGSADGLIRRGWWETGNMPMVISAGAMIKW